jgi:hypothetical protein
MMKSVAVNSTSIAAIGYDERTCDLGIEFLESGELYIYFAVPPEEHQAFFETESKGEYLNLVFKMKGFRFSGPHSGRGRVA